MAPDDNRIQIDLKLLQDKNLELLRDFSDKFEQSVTNLVKRIDDLEAGRKPTTTGAAGQLSGRQSDARDVGEAMESGTTRGLWRPGMPVNSAWEFAALPAAQRWELERQAQRYGGPPGSVPGGPSGPLGPQPNPQASVAPRPGIGGARYGFDTPDMNDYERASFRLGQVGEGGLATTRYMSHLFQRMGQSGRLGFRGQMVQNPETGELEFGEDTNTLGRAMTRFGGRVGQAALIGTYGMQSLQTAQGMVPMLGDLMPGQMGELAGYGTEVGRSRAGLLGTPYLSPAWRTGLSAQYEAFRRSRWGSFNWNPLKGFGLISDPNYSRQQAEEALNITNQFGWTGGQQDRALDMMQHYTRRYGGAIPQETIMRLMEPVLRYGTSSQTEVANSLDQMAEAAKSAHMSLTEFSQRATAAAEELSTALGISGPAALNQVSAYVGATGQTPENAAAVLGNTRNLVIGAAMSGKGLYATAHSGPGALVQAQNAILGPLADPNHWRGMNKAERAQAMEQLQIYYMSDPSLLGGKTPYQFVRQINLQQETGVTEAQGSQARWLIDQGRAFSGPDFALSGDRMQSILRMGGASANDIQGFMEAARTGHTGNAKISGLIKDLDLGEVSGKREISLLAKRLLGANVEAAGKDANNRTRVDIKVAPPYDEIFKALVNGDDASSRNSRKGFGRAASGAGDMLLDLGKGLGPMGLPVDAAGLAAKGLGSIF